ncbi:MAG: RrF2 family transcriptional regulator, partial [Gemmatimonadales bacterium]
MLSQTSQYALRTVLQLARLPQGDRGSAGELARQVGIPRNYLSKTLHQLARAGVVTGTRGKHGGFVLARAPQRITLAEVVAPFQEVGERTCLLGRPACSDARPCAAHGHWKTVAGRVAEFFS